MCFFVVPAEVHSVGLLGVKLFVCWVCWQPGNLLPPLHSYLRYWLQLIQWQVQAQTALRHDRFHVQERKDMIRQCPDLKFETFTGFRSDLEMDLLIVEVI